MSFHANAQQPPWLRYRAFATDKPLPERIQLLTSHLRAGAGQMRPPYDPVAIAKSINVPVLKANNPGWSGAVQSDEQNGWCAIWVDPSDAETRRRFTIAHELGHLLLHREQQMFRDSSFASTNHLEYQANDFAAELLMPKDEFKFYANIVGYDLQGLANVFGVSRAASSVRFNFVFPFRTR